MCSSQQQRRRIQVNRIGDFDELARSPLALVIGQVRFPPVPKMASLVEDVHAAMRSNGLERLTPETVQQVTFGPQIKTTEVTRWTFSNRNRTEAIFLTDDFIVLAVTNYCRFEDFSERLATLVGEVQARARLTFMDQIGIRYLNLLRPTERLAPAEQVAEGLRGLSARLLGVETTCTQALVRCQTELSVLSIRCIELQGPDFLPPDLQIPGLKFTSKPEVGELFRLLDIDNTSSFEDGCDFSDLNQSLWNLHQHTSNAFRNSVTEDALKYWRGEE